MQPTNLADLREKLAAATQGEMTYGIRADESAWYAIGDTKKGPHMQGDIYCDQPLIAAIAALHNAAPAMIAELEALRAEVGRLKGIHAEKLQEFMDIGAEAMAVVILLENDFPLPIEAMDKYTGAKGKAWLAERDAAMKREGAAAALEDIAKDDGTDGGKAYLAKVVYREFPDVSHLQVAVVDVDDLMATAAALRKGGE